MSEWISIRRWRRFQHYDPTKRVPPWIKNYTELMADDAYLSLSEHRALVLHRLWLEYASARCRLPLDTASLSRRLAVRVTTADLDALNHAGFITIVASKTLAEGYQDASARAHVVETEEETETKEEEEVVEGDLLSKPRASRDFRQNPNGDKRFRAGDRTASYTGCRLTRGTHGFGYVWDPLGIDPPPANWPHPKPTNAQIVAARAER